MERNPTAWRRREKEAFRRRLSRITDAATRLRFLAILHTAEGSSQAQIAEMLACSTRTVARVRQRFRERGIEGLLDRRGDNGTAKVTAEYVLALTDAVRGSPQDYDYPRPTWTQELLVTVMAEQTGIRISVATMSRLLGQLGVGRGMPKPTVGCPWSKHAKTRRLRLIRRLIETLGPDQAAVYEDEVDIDLNPKIGPDYMLAGEQKTVLTPGKNVKHYIAGAMDAQSDRIIWVEGCRKASALFIALLKKLDRVYADKTVIHMILDNYGIHSSQLTQRVVEAFAGRLVLHFLPPYCPDDNRIERCLWREVHANVTRNHRCRTMTELMQAFRAYLAKRNRKAAAKRRRAA